MADKKTTKRPNTANRGAADTRSQIKRIVRSVEKEYITGHGTVANVFDEIIRRINRMVILAADKPGGLGRKKAKQK